MPPASCHDVVDGLEAIAGGGLDPALWVQTCLDRIDVRDNAIRAWAYLDRQAGKQPLKDGPLSGVPIGVKDVIDVARMPTGCNSPIEAGRIAEKSAAAVERLVEAGAIVLGKTETTEYAFVKPGPTRNPHDLQRTPGGSSSGSAAAVADGHVPVALTTQTGGSTIRPAAFCGIVGYKPPFGTVPNRGLKLLAPSLDTIGLHARTVADMATVASVLEATPRRAVPAASPAFAIIDLPFEAANDAVNAQLLETALSGLRAAGAPVRRIAAPEEFADIDAAHRTIMAPQVARCFAAIHHHNGDQLSDSLRHFIERGFETSDEAIADANALVSRAHTAIQSALAPDEVLLCPAANGEAPVGLQSTGSAECCRPWTLLGYASLTLPAGKGPTGMPIGLQLVDPTPGGNRLFGHAAFAERALASAQQEDKRNAAAR